MNMPRSVFKNSVALLTARVVYMGSSIVLVYFLSHALQAQGLGSYSTAMALFGLAELATELGLSNFIPRELVKDFTQINRYLVHAWVLVLASAVVAVVVLMGVVPFMGYATETVVSTYLLCLAIFPTALRGVLSAIFIACQRVEFDAYTTILWTSIRIVVCVFLLQSGFGVVAIIAAFTATSYLAFFTSLGFYIRYLDRPHFEFDPAFLRNMLSNLKIFIILALAGSAFVQAETVILSFLKSEVEVGYYSAAYKLITVWYIIPQSFMSVVFPLLSHACQNSLQRSQIIQEKSIKYLLAIGFPLTVGSFAVAGPIINVFYGPGFDQAILVLRVIAWNTVLAFVNNVLWRVLLATNRQDQALRVQITSGLLRIGLSFLLIPGLGTVGAALALMGGYTVYTLMHIYFIRRAGITLPFIRLGWRFGLASGVMGAVVLALNQRLQIFALISLGALFYVILVILLRAFSKEDWALFRQIWARRKEAGVAEPATMIH